MPATRPWAKADWDTFRRELEKCYRQPGKNSTEKMINQGVDRLTKVLTNVLNKAYLLSPACTINKNNPWFTTQLKQLRSEVGAAYLKQKESNTEQHRMIYKDRLK